MPNPILGIKGGRAGYGNLRITVRTDFRRISRSFQSLRKKMSNLREPLKQSAVDYMAKKVIRQRFRAEGEPRWKRHAKATIDRYGPHRILDLTGRLRESATGGRGFFLVYKPSSQPKSVTFGSTVPYAGVHDQARGTYTATGKGGKSLIPGRPWTEVKQKNAEEMRDILMKWTRKKLKESGFKRI